MRNEDSGKWLLRAVCVAAYAALPPLGRLQASVLLLLLPLVNSVMRALRERYAATAITVFMAFGAWRVFPPDVAPGLLVWCAGCGAMLWLDMGDAWRQGLAWLGICAVSMMLTLALLSMRYDGPLAEGLARTGVEWLNARDDAPMLLIRAYQNGLAHLTAKLARVPAMQFGDTVVMTAETRNELAASLRTTLSLALTGASAQLIGGWLTLTPILCAGVPDMIRRKTGGLCDLPELRAWHLPRGVGLAAGLLGVGVLVRVACGATAIGLMGSLCGGAFAVIYGVQGAASMLAQGDEGYSMWRLVWMGALLILCPEVYVLIGAFDQIADPRGLRRAPDEE